MNIEDEKIVCFAIAKNFLQKRKKSVELVYEQKIALEHLKKFTKLNIIDSRKLIDKLVEFNLSNTLAIEIVNVAPTSNKGLNLILSKDKITLDEKKSEWILSFIREHMKKE